ncbi:MAG: hypothetical protein HC853_08845 [Anaerolineae bacterium]|nr:hypothetical protein [Anaerolineae bacterium]
MNKLRLRLTFLYVSAVMAFLAVVGGITYGLVQYYLQSVTDLALRHKMAHEFATLGLVWPKELADADVNWFSVRKSTLPAAFFSTVSRQQEPKAIKNEAAWYPQKEIWLEELYDGELSAIFLLPLNAQGQLIQVQPQDYGVIQSVGLPDAQALVVAKQNTHDLRTVTTSTGAKVRLLTYHVVPTPKTDEPIAYLQLGRVLDDQTYVLDSLITNLGLAGIIFALLGGLGSWLLAGHSLRKEQLLWQRQQTFVANASHELRTPLTLIRANTEVIQRKLPQNADTQMLLSDVLAENGLHE